MNALRKRFKRKRMPVSTICRNCHTQTVGRYCHVCGQDIFAGRGQPIFHLIGQVLENAFALDSKTPVTLKHLLFNPGFLSSEYRTGKINSYVHPVKIFWMSTLVFFALLISQMSFDEKLIGAPQENTAEQIDTIKDSIAKTPYTIKIREKEKNLEIEEFKQGFQLTKDIFSTYAPYITLCFIPVFALLLALFFRRNKFYYMYHLVFAVHFHTFLWIFLSLIIIANILSGEAGWPGWLIVVLLFLPGVYLMIALQRFYRTRKKRTAVWKAILLSFLYFILILFVTVLLVILAARIFFPEILD